MNPAPVHCFALHRNILLFHKHIDGNSLLKGQAQVLAANGTHTRRRNYHLNEDEHLQRLKAYPTTSISSTDSELSDLMALPTEILQTTPPRVQQTEDYRSEDESTEALLSTEESTAYPESTTSMDSATTMESTDSATTAESMASTASTEVTPTRTEDPDQAEAKKKSTTQISPRPKENPLNYVAALRIRQERGRHKSPDLFEEY